MTSQAPEVGLAPPPAQSERDPTNRATIRCRFSAAFTPSRGFFSRAFTANENLPRSAVEALCAEGHNVAWVRAEAPGATDEQYSPELAPMGASYSPSTRTLASSSSNGAVLPATEWSSFVCRSKDRPMWRAGSSKRSGRETTGPTTSALWSPSESGCGPWLLEPSLASPHPSRLSPLVPQILGDLQETVRCRPTAPDDIW